MVCGETVNLTVIATAVVVVIWMLLRFWERLARLD